MADCDNLESDFDDALRDRDETWDTLRDQQKEQFTNYKEYLGILTDGFAEFAILALFGEGDLGMALGGYTMFASGEVNNMEDKIGELHDEIEASKSDYEAAKTTANDAAKKLCQCYWEHGGMPL